MFKTPTVAESEDREQDQFKRMYKDLIIEKLGLNYFCKDFVNRYDFAQPPKGFNRAMISHPQEDIVFPRLLCNFCEHVVILPQLCNDCDAIYCKDCAEWLAGLPMTFLMKPCENDEFVCINLDCIQKDDYRSRIPVVEGIIKTLVDDMKYKCRNKLCDFKQHDFGVVSHEEYCRRGPRDWSVDFTLFNMTNKNIGTKTIECIGRNPPSIKDALRLNVRRKEESIESYYRQYRMYEYVLSKYPNRHRSEYAKICGIPLGKMDAIREKLYGERSNISDHEKELRALDFPAYELEDIDHPIQKITPLPDRDMVYNYSAKDWHSYKNVKDYRTYENEMRRDFGVFKRPPTFKSFAKDSKNSFNSSKRPHSQRLDECDNLQNDQLKQPPVKKANNKSGSTAGFQPSKGRNDGNEWGEWEDVSWPATTSQAKSKWPTPVANTNDTWDNAECSTQQWSKANQFEVQYNKTQRRRINITKQTGTRPKYVRADTAELTFRKMQGSHIKEIKDTLEKMKNCVTLVDTVRYAEKLKELTDGKPWKAEEMVKEYENPNPVPEVINWDEIYKMQLPEASIASSQISYIPSIQDEEDREVPYIKEPIWVQDEVWEKHIATYSSYRPAKQRIILPRDEKKNEKRRLKREKLRQVALNCFNNRKVVEDVPVSGEMIDKVAEGIASIQPHEKIISVSIECCTGTDSSGKPEPKPIWIAIVNHQMKVIYETLIRQTARMMHTELHGLKQSDINNALNESAVRIELLKFLVAATTIVGAGVHNLFTTFGITRDDEAKILPKMRDVTVYFTPYEKESCNMAVSSYLRFKKQMCKLEDHSPVTEARTAMKLYLSDRKNIEDKALELNGMTYKVLKQVKPNTDIVQDLRILTYRYEADKTPIWPPCFTRRIDGKYPITLPVYHPETQSFRKQKSATTTIEDVSPLINGGTLNGDSPKQIEEAEDKNTDEDVVQEEAQTPELELHETAPEELW